MAEILIASMQPIGHFGPLLHVAEGLVDRGDRISFLTAAHRGDQIRAIGARPLALPSAADFDETRLDIDYPGRESTSGIKRVNFDVTRLFVNPIPHQAAALAEAMKETRFDAIISDALFLGVLPYLVGDAANRPPILMFSTTPLTLSSRDTAPFGMGLPPSSTPLGRVRNRGLKLVSHKFLMRESHRTATRVLAGMNAAKLPVFVLDAGLLADRYLAATVPEFDYPRSDLPSRVRYVGAVHPAPSRTFRPPRWWPELDGDRPVVHVTQGTIDNADLGRLLEPTIAALADEDVMVVATTGGRDISQLSIPLPRNTHVAEYIPHHELLPKVDVMVTNGGFGAVQKALSTGVPLVVAGNTEDKPEVAARVAWSGAGIDLKTGTPTSGQVRNAVRKILDNPRYLRRARELESAYARRDGVAEVAALVDEVIAQRSFAGR
jgi:MGT family glycosyltransferase